MNKFYVPEISLRDIRNNIGILSKFEEKYNKSISRYSVILSNNGYYKYDKDKLTKYKFIERESNITENFFKNYTLIEINCFEKKIGEVFQIPYENKNIIMEKIKFNVGKSSNYIVFEKISNKIVDVYFLSNKKINEKCKFFTEDVSSFIEMLNI